MKAMKDLKYHAGIIVRIYPSDRQKHIIALNSGAQRYVYNHLVAANNEIYLMSKTAASVPCYRDRIDYLKKTLSYRGIKNAAPFLYEKEIDSLVVSNAIKNYQNAWKNMKELHHGVPVFHKKGYEQAYDTGCSYPKKGLPSIRFMDEKHLHLPILGRIRMAGSDKRIWQIMDRSHEKDPGFIRIGTVKVWRDACLDYFVSLALASDKPFRECHDTDAEGRPDRYITPVGIDMNLSNFCTLSDGSVVDNPRYRNNMQKKIARRQRSMSRKAVRARKEGRRLWDCKNYQKDRLKAAKLLRKTARQRNDFYGRTSCDIVKNHDIIAAEDLKVLNMLKNHKLAKAISDAGWSRFHAILKQKAEACGRIFVKVPARNTTQTCNHCGHVCHGDEKIVLGQDEWVCPECGALNKRDYNAALNILDKGLELLNL